MKPSRSVVAAGCYWCGRRFQMRQTGGHAQRFCTARCRLAFHTAARRWTVDAIEAGVLSIEDIKQSAPTNVYVAADAIALIGQPKTRQDRLRALPGTTSTNSGAIHHKDNR